MTTARLVPDVARPDVGLVAFEQWTVGTPERQRAAADATLAAWRDVSWPAGLLSHSCLLGADGETVAHYSQWASEQARRAFVNADVPDAEHHCAIEYWPPRHRIDATLTPECIVLIHREFDGPDLERARRWVDAMFAVPPTDPPPGLISAHMHVSTDGARALNYAQWTSEDAHRALVERTARRLEENPKFRAVESWPELVRTWFERYRPCWSIAGPPT